MRAQTLHARDLRYGPSADETLDLVVPHTGAPLLVWFHGGYWRRFHKDDNTFVARGLGPHGIATAIVNYSLAPAAPLEEIVAQARRAVGWLRENARWHGADPSRIVVAGHSAGGHLAAMCAVDAPVARRRDAQRPARPAPVCFRTRTSGCSSTTRARQALSPLLLPPAAPTTVIARRGRARDVRLQRPSRGLRRRRGARTTARRRPASPKATTTSRSSSAWRTRTTRSRCRSPTSRSPADAAGRARTSDARRHPARHEQRHADPAGEVEREPA